MEATKEYDKFNFIGFNRDPDDSHVKELQSSMEQFGFLNPVTVTTDWKVIDGQHRILAAKNLDLPVPYHMVEMGDDKIPHAIGVLNTTSKKWRLEDFKNLYVALGNNDYRRFADFIEKHSLSVRDGIVLASDRPQYNILGKEGSLTEAFRKGGYKFSNNKRKEIDEKYGQQIEEIRFAHEDFADFRDSERFTHAVVCLILHPHYDHGRMMAQMEKFGARFLSRRISAEEYLEDLYTLYDHNHRDPINRSLYISYEGEVVVGLDEYESVRDKYYDLPKLAELSEYQLSTLQVDTKKQPNNGKPDKRFGNKKLWTPETVKKWLKEMAQT